MYAKFILIGNVGKNPETRFSQDGAAITSFSVALNYKRGEERLTEWFDVVSFGKHADFCQQYIKTGSKVYIEAIPSFDQWEKDGVKHKKMKLISKEIRLLDKKEETSSEPSPAPTSASNSYPKDKTMRDVSPWPEPPVPTTEELNDEIPF